MRLVTDELPERMVYDKKMLISSFQAHVKRKKVLKSCPEAKDLVYSWREKMYTVEHWQALDLADQNWSLLYALAHRAIKKRGAVQAKLFS
jgi:hypothetical protein